MFKKKKLISLAILLITLSISLIFSTYLFGYKLSDKPNSKERNRNNIKEIEITNFRVDGRTTMMKDNAIYVGNNIKELENNFYDIKILNLKSTVEVFLNKLWYESYGKDYIQDEYLAEISRELSDKLNIEMDKDQLSYSIYKYVKDNYIRLRQNEKTEEITVDKLKLQLKLDGSIVKLIIQRGN